MVLIPTFDTRERRGFIIMRDKITDVGTLAKSVAEGGGHNCRILQYFNMHIHRQCCNSLLVSRCIFIIIIILYVES